MGRLVKWPSHEPFSTVTSVWVDGAKGLFPDVLIVSKLCAGDKSNTEYPS